MVRASRPFASSLFRGVLLAGLAIAWLAFLFEHREPLILERSHASLPDDQQRIVTFVGQARHAVLPGSSFTIAAPAGEIERLLWSNAVARTPRRQPVAPRSPEAESARFVIVWGHARLAEPDARMVVRFDDGAVWERDSAND